MCVQNHSNPSNLIGSTTPLSCQVTSVLLLSHSNIPWNFGCGHGPSRSKARKANTICPKKTQLKKNNKKCTFYEDLVFHVAWGIWFFGIPQICLWKMSPASPMMWMFTLDKEFLKPGLRRSSFTSHKDFYLFKCCFLDAKKVQQTVPLRSIESLQFDHSQWEMISLCIQLKTCSQVKLSALESQAAHSITTFLVLSQDCLFSRTSHLQQSHCLSSWWTMFFDYQAMSRIMLASSPPPGDGPRSRSAKT